MPELAALLESALASGDDTALRAELEAGSRLPGARLNLRLVDSFAAAVAEVVVQPSPPVAQLEALLDGWAALPEEDAPGDQPAVVLPCAAVRAYGHVGAARPDWWPDETAKLHRAAADARWRIREVVAQSLQHLLAADWPRTISLLHTWAGSPDPLVVRAAAAAVAEPPLLRDDPARAADAASIQEAAVASYRSLAPEARRSTEAQVLRQALAFTLSVTTAATQDFTLLDALATSGDKDPDLTWIARQNLKKSRLRKLRP